MSLGASGGTVVAMILRQGMTLVGIGLLIGLVLGAGVGRLLSGSRFSIPAADPGVFVMAALLFFAVGLAACYAPVRRAMRVGAMDALRYE